MQPADRDDASEDAWAERTSGAIAAGDRSALGDLYARRFDLLYRTVRRGTRCDEDFALDCVQEAMIKVASSMRAHASTRSLDAWLRRVVLSAALDRLRQERSRSRREAARVRSDATDMRIDAIDLERLRAEVDALAIEERALLDLRFRRGATLAVAGDAAGLAPKAVDSRIRRTLAKLRGAFFGDLPKSDPHSEDRP